MIKTIKFHFSNDKVITVKLDKEYEDILKILDKQWFVNIEPMIKKCTCINLDKVNFIEVCNEND